MTTPKLPNDERGPDPTGVDAGPQSGQGGAGGEPRGARLDARAEERRAPPADRSHPREHSSDKAKPGYRARPAGQSGLGAQDEQSPTLGEPQGEGNYVATDRGDTPLRNG